MGNFNVTIEVGDLERRRYVTMEALVDTVASYLVVPRPVLDSGHRVQRKAAFRAGRWASSTIRRQ
jgi:hypothetical protein